MLKRLYIDNFRCFVGFTYEPQRSQLLLGANGTGKSTLLDAIRLLKALLKGYDNPFLDSTRTRWDNRSSQIIEVESLLDGQVYFYRLETRFAKDSPVSRVYAESLRVQGEAVFEQIDGKILILAGQDPSSMLPLKTTNSSLQLASLSSVKVARFLDWIERVHCLYIDAYPDAMSDTSDGEDPLPDDELENLADWYRHLAQADLPAVVATMRSLEGALDGFHSLQLDRTGASSRVLKANFKVNGETIPYLLSELSPGQRQLIALFLILHSLIARGETVILDEPTTHVSLREIQPWLIEALEAVHEHDGQLILVSHETEILNYLAKDYGLLFTREESGLVRTKPYRDVLDSGLEPAETLARGWEDE